MARSPAKVRQGRVFGRSIVYNIGACRKENMLMVHDLGEHLVVVPHCDGQ